MAALARRPPPGRSGAAPGDAVETDRGAAGRGRGRERPAHRRGRVRGAPASRPTRSTLDALVAARHAAGRGSAPSPSPGCPRERELEREERIRLDALVTRDDRDLRPPWPDRTRARLRLATAARPSRHRRARRQARARSRTSASTDSTALAGRAAGARGGLRGGRADHRADRRRALACPRRPGHAQDLRQVYLDLRERRITGMAAELAGAPRRRLLVPGLRQRRAPVARGCLGRRSAAPTRRRLASATRPPTSSGRHVQELVTTLSPRGSREPLVRSQAGTPSPLANGRRGRAATAAQRAPPPKREATRCEDELDRLDAEEQPHRHRARWRLRACRSPTHAEQRVAADAPERPARCRAARAARRPPRRHLVGDRWSAAAPPVGAAILDAGTRRARAARSRDRASASSRQAAAAATQALPRPDSTRSRPALDGRALRRASAAPARAELDERRIARAPPRPSSPRRRSAGALAAELPTCAALAALARRRPRRLRDAAHAAHEQVDARVEPARVARRRAHSTRSPPGRRCGTSTPWSAGLAALVEGKSADNQLRMRLSAYVLSERLRQVVAAANERLGAMTDERYTPRADRRARRRRAARRAEPAGARRVERQAARPGHAVGR